MLCVVPVDSLNHPSVLSRDAKNKLVSGQTIWCSVGSSVHDSYLVDRNRHCHTVVLVVRVIHSVIDLWFSRVNDVKVVAYVVMWNPVRWTPLVTKDHIPLETTNPHRIEGLTHQSSELSCFVPHRSGTGMSLQLSRNHLTVVPF